MKSPMKNMAYWKAKNASPLEKKMGPYKPFDVDKLEEYPGYNNPNTPDYLYKADGTKVNTSNIDESELKGDKADNKGKYTLYAPEGQEPIKYYYNKP